MVVSPDPLPAEVTVCLQCGDQGATNAFVYCVDCLEFAVHRYCLDDIPKTLDEYVRWFCDDCEAKPRNQRILQSFKVKDVPRKSKKRRHEGITSLQLQEACDEIDSTETSQLIGDFTVKVDLMKDTPMKPKKKRKKRYERIISSQLQGACAEIDPTETSQLMGDRTVEIDLKKGVHKRSKKRSRKKKRHDSIFSSQPQGAYAGIDSTQTSQLEGQEVHEQGEYNAIPLGEDGQTHLSRSFDQPVRGQPVIDIIWEGCFKICNTDYDIIFDGLVAHLSVKASEKVYKEANSFPRMLTLEMLPKSVIWPKSFLTSEPTDENIALYFFPSDTKCEQGFDYLVDEMIREELALRAILRNAELLVFTSRELPPLYWTFNGKNYLWGVFRGKQQSSEQASEVQYYEVVNPLLEPQGLKTLKVAFRSASKDVVTIHTIILPKQSTVGDVLNDLKMKVELSHPEAELRLLGIYLHKIFKIFPLHKRINNINDHYWTLRAEEIPKEETKLSPHDRLIHVCHFMKDTTQSQHHVQNFGEPFFLVIHEKDTLADVKARIQNKLHISHEEFSKWKFAFLSMDQLEYLQDTDTVATYFQRRDVYSPCEEYLGLEHSDDDAHKESYGVNKAQGNENEDVVASGSSTPPLLSTLSPDTGRILEPLSKEQTNENVALVAGDAPPLMRPDDPSRILGPLLKEQTNENVASVAGDAPPLMISDDTNRILEPLKEQIIENVSPVPGDAPLLMRPDDTNKILGPLLKEQTNENVASVAGAAPPLMSPDDTYRILGPLLKEQTNENAAAVATGAPQLMSPDDANRMLEPSSKAQADENRATVAAGASPSLSHGDGNRILEPSSKAQEDENRAAVAAGASPSPSLDDANRILVPSSKTQEDENGAAVAAGASPSLSLDDVNRILKPLSKEQLVSILRNTTLWHQDVLEAIRAIADADATKRKLYVWGLAPCTTSNKLAQVFSIYGELNEAGVPKDRNTGKSRRFGFVNFRHIDGAIMALKERNKKIDGHMTTTLALGTQTTAEASRKIYVGNVPFEISPERLLDFFSMYGEIEEGPLCFDKQSGKEKGCALFLYKSEAGAKAALRVPEKMIDGYRVECKLGHVGCKLVPHRKIRRKRTRI